MRLFVPLIVAHYTSGTLPAEYTLPPGYHVFAPGGVALQIGGPNRIHAIAFRGPAGIVVSFEGTVLSSNILDMADLGLLGTGPGVSAINQYYSKASAFLKTVRNYARTLGLPVHLTGHSLGGAIAQILGNQTGLDTVTFNAPGTKTYMLSQGIMNLVNINSNIRNYRMEGDLVSLLPGKNTQVGKVITLANSNGNNFPGNPLTFFQNHMCIIQNFADCNPDSAPISDNGVLPAAAGGTTTASLYPEPASVMVGQVAIGLTAQKVAQKDFALYVKHNVLEYLDPPTASEFDFATGLGNPNFASVILPAQADSYDLQALVNNAWINEGLLAPLTTFNFGDGGVSEFKVFGADPSLFPNAPFIVGVTFTGDGEFTGTITAKRTIPAPPTISLISLGIVLMGISVRRRSRAYPDISEPGAH